MLGFADGMWRVCEGKAKTFCWSCMRRTVGSGVRRTMGEVDDDDKTWYFCVCGFRKEGWSVGDVATATGWGHGCI